MRLSHFINKLLLLLKEPPNPIPYTLYTGIHAVSARLIRTFYYSSAVRTSPILVDVLLVFQRKFHFYSYCLSKVPVIANKKAQLTLSNPRDVKACQNCSNSTCFVSFHRIPFPQIANASRGRPMFSQARGLYSCTQFEIRCLPIIKFLVQIAST